MGGGPISQMGGSARRGQMPRVQTASKCHSQNWSRISRAPEPRPLHVAALTQMPQDNPTGLPLWKIKESCSTGISQLAALEWMFLLQNWSDLVNVLTLILTKSTQNLIYLWCNIDNKILTFWVRYTKTLFKNEAISPQLIENNFL